MRSYIFTDIAPNYYHPFDSKGNVREPVSDIVLRLDNGFALGIGPELDFCVVSLLDRDNSEAELPYGELKRGLE